MSGGDLKTLGAFIILSLLLFGCIGTQSSTSGAMLKAQVSPAYAPAPGGTGQVVTQQGYITLRVPEGTLEQRFSDMKTALENQGAQTSDIAYNEYSDRKQYSITVKVPPSKFDDINTALKGMGEVKGMSVQLQDVTQQYNDLDTQISNKQIELQRLQALYNQSANVSDLLAVESQLTRVQTELDSLQQQKQALVSQVEMSTIVITMYEDTPATSQLSLSLEGLGSMFFGALAAAITLLVLAVGFLIPIAIVAVVIWAAYMAVAGRKKGGPKPPEHKKIPPPQ